MEQNVDSSRVIWQAGRQYDVATYSDDDIENVFPVNCLLKVKPTDTQTGDEKIKVLLAGEKTPRLIELWEVYYFNLIVKKVYATDTEVDLSLIKVYA